MRLTLRESSQSFRTTAQTNNESGRPTSAPMATAGAQGRRLEGTAAAVLIRNRTAVVV